MKVFYLFLMLCLFSCSTSRQSIQLVSLKGSVKVIDLKNKPNFFIAIDSSQVDSSMYSLFSWKDNNAGLIEYSSYWFIDSIDTVLKKVCFHNCADDKLRVELRADQIKYLQIGTSRAGLFLANLMYFPSFMLFTYAILAPVFGLVLLPIPSTPWQDDLKILGSGLAALGVVAVVWKVGSSYDEADHRYILKGVE